MLDALLLYPIRFLCLGVALAILCGARISRRAVWIVGGLGLTAYLLSVVVDPPRAKDFADYFWPAGNALWHGQNPYDIEGVLNPPTAFPLYLAVGGLPLAFMTVLWTILLVVGALFVVEVARRALAASGDEDARSLEPSFVLLLTAILCQSRANRMGIELGQLALPVTLFLFGAFWAYHRGRQFIAGALMALASVKTPTMLPCLLVISPRKGWKTWLSLSVVGFALVLSTTAPGDILLRCKECLANISEAKGEGRSDNLALENHRNTSMVSLDLLANRLGIENTTTIQIVQGVLLLSLLCVIGKLVWGSDRLSPAATMALISLFAMLFLYHRLYDLLFLALPLVYVSGRARNSEGFAHYLYVICAVCLFIAMNTMPWLLMGARQRVLDVQDPLSTALRMFVLPHLTWIVLSSLLLLVMAERASRSHLRSGTNLLFLVSRGNRETVNKTLETAT